MVHGKNSLITTWCLHIINVIILMTSIIECLIADVIIIVACIIAHFSCTCEYYGCIIGFIIVCMWQ